MVPNGFERFRSISNFSFVIVQNGSERFRSILNHCLIYSSERFRTVSIYLTTPIYSDLFRSILDFFWYQVIHRSERFRAVSIYLCRRGYIQFRTVPNGFDLFLRRVCCGSHHQHHLKLFKFEITPSPTLVTICSKAWASSS